jgi:polyisoprenoid-binding protein YceI
MIALVVAAALAQEAPADAPATETAAPAVQTYTLDAGKSFLGVLVKYDRSALIGGHDHVVSPNTFTGEVTWGDDPAACDIDIRFPVTALQVDPPGSRARMGLEGSTSDNDKAKIKSNLEGKHQLEADKYPQVSFKSTKCAAKGDKVAVTGTLTLHGVGATVTADMDVDASATGFAAKGGFVATHSTWSMDPYTALLGSLKNAPELSFTIDVKGAP